MAASIDGYIADAEGGIGWLAPYENADFGYERLMEQVECVVVGRATFDMIAGFDHWPYDGKRVVVTTHRPLPPHNPSIEAFAGDVAELAARLRQECHGDIYVDGGAQTLRNFVDADLVDRFDLFTLPVLLGQGIPRFLPSPRLTHLRLDSCQAMDLGVVRTSYVRP